ncbi:MAG: arsenosugar biosynthesis radical SAM protein ArsS [Candidatus Sumerlaeia bacterium]|nr:arsenosugar biosynthesis radical SAM protein ArsS [Candidatus Sumerlaeia bacterium]
MNAFDTKLAENDLVLGRGDVEILQLNVGRVCNQTCRHCHVSAGPNRPEILSEDVAREMIDFLDRAPTVHTMDITGGAPELVPPFRWLVTEARRRDLHIIDRCNLTILTEPGHEDLARFLAENRVHVVASLPCYTSGNVDKQRGDGVFARSIKGLSMLNDLGYGISPDLPLDLVYNPLGPSLPPPQASLEDDYRKRLREDFNVSFTSLITITNMPIGRFRTDLERSGKLEGYMDVLLGAFNTAAIPGLMCRNTLSVDYLGYLHDCDFNQMLDLGLSGRRLHIRDMDGEKLRALAIATGDHCLGCTAGAGSSCSGVLVR